MDKQLLDIIRAARKALDQIANCSERDPARYVAKVDLIAVDALIALDLAMDDLPHN